MMSVWQTTYSKIHFIDINELLTYDSTFELADFTVFYTIYNNTT